MHPSIPSDASQEVLRTLRVTQDDTSKEWAKQVRGRYARSDSSGT